MVGNRNVIPIFFWADEVHSLRNISARRCYEANEGAADDNCMAHGIVQSSGPLSRVLCNETSPISNPQHERTTTMTMISIKVAVQIALLSFSIRPALDPMKLERNHWQNLIMNANPLVRRDSDVRTISE